ncbi:MAG TPA: M48 family metallopeptidase [Xanthobacteraceae bacterium]|nr:M48 family metallopeptidase [Xanthobacteraceae bacterium]
MTITLDTSAPVAPDSAPAVPRGRAIYFDGTCSARHDVTIEVAAAGLRIIAAKPAGRVLDEWAYPDLRRMSSPEGVLRLGRCGETLLARLEIRDPDLVCAIEDRAETLDRGGGGERRLRRKIAALSFAACVSLVVTAIYGVPELVTRLVPFVPASVERKLGEAVDKNVYAALDTRHLGHAFVCGRNTGELAGRAALDKLVGKLAAAAALPVALRVDVVRRPEPNAVALPGGRIYVDQGLIDQAQTPDELAGVLAHEMGHVAARDGTRVVLQTAGLSFLFGMMLGDFVGGGAVVIAAKTVLRSSYSRRVENAADAYSVALMLKAGGDPHALGAILARIVTDKKHGLAILSNHPETKDRIAAINAVETGAPSAPILDVADWSALKQICAPLPPQDSAGGKVK